MPRFDLPDSQIRDRSLIIDAATRKSLELTKTMSGERRGSLLSIIDRTVTGPGARLLVQRLQTPSSATQEIEDHLDCVEYFVRDLSLLEETRHVLRQTHDMERCVQRIILERGSPRDLAAIGNTIQHMIALRELFEKNVDIPVLLQIYLDTCELAYNTDLDDQLKNALQDADVLPNIEQGGFIRDGYSKELDKWRSIHANSSSLTSDLQERYRKITKVSKLSIKSNSIIGYFVEAPAAQRDKLLEPFVNGTEKLIFKPVHGTISVARFRTAELTELEAKISRAQAEAVSIETKIFKQLCDTIRQFENELVDAARSLANLDLYSSLAMLARENGYNRPVVMEPSSTPVFEIVNGRHPIVEQARRSSTSLTACTFVGNDCVLNGNDLRIMLVTGPNMGGKSTYLRQNALIVIMAQMGSFVPADKGTRFTVVDKIFSRVGASDELANDRSTFMVEMTETANILTQATNHSFVIIDEIGRGTATLDGLSIAWSVLEYLHDIIGCRTLFATHFHELTELAGTSLNRVGPFSLGVRVQGHDLIFTYKVENKAADESYGVHVARLAGLPSRCIERAEQLLTELKTQEQEYKKFTKK
jgi:DNA mismatch repair protein MutS